MLSLSSLSLISFFGLAAFAAPAERDASAQSPVYPNCAKVTFTATASALNFNLPVNIDLSAVIGTILGGGVNISLSLPVNLTSNIVARYCEPEVKIDGRGDKLELMLHSITNNKNLWSGLGEPGQGYQGDNYSWIAYASKQGYPTLSLDRLGNGESDHPDPILVVQGPYEFALYNAIIQQIRSGVNSPLPRKYDYIVGIGNSYGSGILSAMAAQFPTAFTDVILTGYTYDILASFPGIVAVAPLPAAVALPTRFGNLAPGYLTTTSVDGRRGAFYGLPQFVDFDFAITTLDNNVRDVVSVGQFVANYLLGAQVATAFTGRALVLTGEEDNAFCGPGETATEALLGVVKCGSRIPDSGKLFPVAKDYSYYSVGRTGHSNMLHYSRFTSFKVAHDFIGGAHFAVANGA